MDNDPNAPNLFRETQRFTQWWLWVLLISINLLFLTGTFLQVVAGQTFGSKPMGNGLLIGATIFMIAFTIGLLSIRLHTIIRTEGIYLRFSPVHSQYRFYPWDDIMKVSVRNYSPLKEFGGWGIRTGSKENGDAYNISGNQGLQLYLNNNRKLMIGTQKPEELKLVLSDLQKLTE